MRTISDAKENIRNNSKRIYGNGPLTKRTRERKKGRRTHNITYSIHRRIIIG
jgi:hypothetical protein